MDISLLIDCPEETGKIAKWYFNEWAYKDPDATEQKVANKIMLGANRTELPLAFVIHEKKQLVGVAEIKYRELDEFPNFTFWLDGVYVPPEFRGKGISTKLIEYAKDKAKSLGIKALHLSCEKHNVPLYENRGFKIVKLSNSKFIMAFNLNT